MTDKLSKEDGALLLELARESILREFEQENDRLGSLKTKPNG